MHAQRPLRVGPMSAACFCAAMALSVAAHFSPAPADGVLCLAAFSLIGVGWAVWLFLESD